MASELVDELVRVASATVGVPAGAVKGLVRVHRGLQSVSYARHAVWYVLREQGWLLEQIGEAFGRHHTSVHHGVTRIEMLMRADRDCQSLVHSLRAVAERFTSDARLDMDARSAIERMDRELIWARQLALELTQRIDALQQARGALMQVVDPVVTRNLQAVV